MADHKSVPLREQTRWRSSYAALAGIVYGLGFYTYIAYRVTPILFLLFIPFFRKLPGFWKRTALFIIVTFIVAAPIGWYFATTPGSFFGRTAEISVTSASNPVHDFAVNIGKEALMFNYHGDYNWRQNVSGAPELFWPVGILFLLGIVLSDLLRDPALAQKIYHGGEREIVPAIRHPAHVRMVYLRHPARRRFG